MTIRIRSFALALLLLALAVPDRVHAQGLLDAGLSLSGSAALPDLRVVLAAAPAQDPSLDFDLLGDAPKPAVPAEDPSLRTRRKMLNLHQGLGIGLLALQVASTVTGQLNYNDKFGTANTGKYKETHKVIVWTNVGAFVAVGGIALFAPRDKSAPNRPWGRTTVHKVGMALATVGMATQAYLGMKTASREGYLDKEDWGQKHLVVGYATLAVMAVAVGALII